MKQLGREYAWSILVYTTPDIVRLERYFPDVDARNIPVQVLEGKAAIHRQ